MANTTPRQIRLPLINHMFPVLTAAQQARIATHGRVRQVLAGETLVEADDQSVKFVVVVKGQLKIARSSRAGGEVVAVLGPGKFSGELNMLSGRRGLVRIRAGEPSEVIEIDREQLLALVQTDSELSDILMRAFILRRLELIARGIGDVVLVGSSHSLDTFRIKEFLTRNGHPYSYIDLDRDADVQDLLDRFNVAITDLPVLICRGQVVLRKPDQSADRRLPRLQRGNRPDAGTGSGNCRRRARGTGGGSLRSVGGT